MESTDFKDMIKKARIESGKTIFELSYSSSVRPERWTEIENGQLPTPNECATICTILKIDQATACECFAKDKENPGTKVIQFLAEKNVA